MHRRKPSIEQTVTIRRLSIQMLKRTAHDKDFVKNDDVSELS